MVDDRGEVSGTVEFDLRQTNPIGLHHPFNTYTQRFTGVNTANSALHYAAFGK